MGSGQEVEEGQGGSPSLMSTSQGGGEYETGHTVGVSQMHPPRRTK